MKKTALIILLFSFSLAAQTAGSTGLSFLKFGFGARNIAMGDAASSAAKDVTALFYNPANLAGDTNAEIIFMHNEWIQDVRSEILGTKFDLFGLPFALGFNVTTVSDIEVRTKPGEADSKFNANFFYGSLSTGFFVTDDISFGATAKYLYEGLLADEANGLGFDLGLTYSTPVKGLTASAVVRNLGSMNQLRNEETKLPAEIRAGGMYDFNLGDSDFDLNAAAEFHKYLDTDDTHLNLGAETIYDNKIALRAGYQTGYESRGFTGGLGIIWGNLKFDYAFLPFSFGLGSANLFSLQFKF